MGFKFDSVESAIQDIQAGKLVIILDSKDREYEGDFVGAAQLVTPQTINFMLNYGRGAFIAVFMPYGRCDELNIDSMIHKTDSFNATKFRVSVDAKVNDSGSSAHDRADTVRLLGSEISQSDDFVRPGHVVPIEAHPDGVFGRQGHTEAGVELVRLSGITPASAVDLEILDYDGSMAREDRLFSIAKQYNLKVITVESIVNFIGKESQSLHSSIVK